MLPQINKESRDKVLLFITCVTLSFTVFAQKRPLDEEAYKKWRYVEKENISHDGKWISFEHRNKDSLQVLYLCGQQKTDTLTDCTNGSFSYDARFFAYSQKADSKEKNQKKQIIYVLKDLRTGETEKFPHISTFNFMAGKRNLLKMIRQNTQSDSLKKSTTATQKANFDLILYRPEAKDSVCLRNLSMIKNTQDDKWLFLRSGEWTLYNTENNTQQVLPLTSGAEISIINFSKKEDRLACLYKKEKEKEQRILLYDVSKKRLTDSISSTSGILPQGFAVTSGRLSFSGDGKLLFFSIIKQPKDEKKKEDPKATAYEPQIWAWDQTSNFLATKTIVMPETYFCSLNLANKKLTLLSSGEMPYLQFPDGASEEISLGFSDKPYQHLTGIEAGPLYDAYLVNMITGKQTKILERKYYNPTISTDKKYIVWFEPDSRSWYSMDTKTLEKRNLTATIDDLFYNDELDLPMHDTHFGTLGWSDKEHSIFINSKYDWWKIDASGQEAPICLTRNEGKKNKMILRPIKKSESQRYYSTDSTFYLTAFQPSTKKAGYYKLQKGELKKLVFTDHRYSELKFSEDGTTCTWKRESFTEYPELYASDVEFQHIKRISLSDEIQKEYNWGTNELVQWRTFQGDTLQGILCKPQDFDPAKKYPMIVYFYERKSNNLHKYNIPAPIGTVVNWSYCVSNGYLVFIPDVTFRSGDPGRSSYDAIVSGVKELTDRYSFIDKDHIGLNGHSWGGYQSAYLITQTNLFKAAVAGAPVVNMTSAYGGIRWETGKSRMFQYEHAQSRMGGTLWEKPMEYIKNSPLFFAPQIQTPVLIMHNDQDGSVMWEQGIEFFMALRRLGKPAWMFNYKGQGHKLLKWDYRMNYSKKVMEFYDYYLKNKDKPTWM